MFRLLLPILLSFLQLLPVKLSAIFPEETTYVYQDDLGGDAEIQECVIRANLDEQGILRVKQSWLFDDRQNSKGSEHFFEFQSPTVDFVSVKLDGREMEQISGDWPVQAGREEKAFKWGIHKTVSGSRELCFGITEQALHRFEVEYTDSKPLQITQDGYAFLNYQWINDGLSVRIGKVLIDLQVQGNEIKRIYGFGFEGLTYFVSDDEAAFESIDTRWSPERYGIFLVELKQQLYQEERAKSLSSREALYQESFKDSDFDIRQIDQEPVRVLYRDLRTKSPQQIKMMLNTGAGKKQTGIRTMLQTIWFVYLAPIFSSKSRLRNFVLLLLALIFLPGILRRIFRGSRHKAYKKFLTRADKMAYYRDEPPMQDVLLPLLHREGLIKEPRDLITYYFTKWVHEGRLRIETICEISLLAKPEFRYTFVPPSRVGILDFEQQLYAFFLEVGVNRSENMLTGQTGAERGEEYSFVSSDLDHLPQTMQLRFEGLLKGSLLQKSETLGGRPYCDPPRHLKVEYQEGVRQHVAFRHFLLDFTRIQGRGLNEVLIWDFYLEMAALYGMADTLQKELDCFEQVMVQNREGHQVPLTYAEESRIWQAIHFAALLNTNGLDDRGSSSSSSSRSSGGGGRSSLGGGGGSSGGGHSGGSR